MIIESQMISKITSKTRWTSSKSGSSSHSLARWDWENYSSQTTGLKGLKPSWYPIFLSIPQTAVCFAFIWCISGWNSPIITVFVHRTQVHAIFRLFYFVYLVRDWQIIWIQSLYFFIIKTLIVTTSWIKGFISSLKEVTQKINAHFLVW